MNSIFEELKEENYHDPIVHAHLENYSYGGGGVSERDMLIALVKDLVKSNNTNLHQINYLLKNSPPKF